MTDPQVTIDGVTLTLCPSVQHQPARWDTCRLPAGHDDRCVFGDDDEERGE